MGNKVSVDITSFSAGEVDASLSGRTDDPNYNKSLQLCENWIPTIHGGIVKRGGTFRAGTSSNGQPATLIPYGDSFMIEFTSANCRVLDDEGALVAATGASTPFGFGYSNLNWAQKDDLLFICNGTSAPYVFTARSDGTSPTLTALVFDKGPLDTQNIDLDLYYLASAVSGSVTLQAWSDVTGSAAQVDSTLAVGQLIGFKCIPQMLAKQWVSGETITSGDYRWSQSYESSRVNMYKATNGSSTAAGTRAPGHDTGTESDGVITWQMVHSEWGFARVASATGSPRVATATVVGFPEIPIDATAATGHAKGTWRWAEGLWGKTDGVATGGGAISVLRTNYPKCVTFHQQRAVFGGGDIDQQQLHGSAIDDFTNFYPGLTDSNAAYKFLLDSDTPVSINSLASLNNLAIGTSGGVFMARASNGGPITPTDIDIRLKSSVPIKAQQGCISEQSIFWIESGSFALHEFLMEGDNLTAFNRGFVNESIGTPVKVVKMASPYNVIWVLDNLYKIYGFSNSEQYGLRGWHRHEIAGSFDAGNGVYDIAVLPSAPNRLWLSLDRSEPTAGASIELMSFDTDTSNPVGNGTIGYSGLYLDCAAYQSTALTTITGLDHLEGETINIVKDGAVVQEIVVESNQAVMSEERSAFFYGLPFTASGKTQKLEGGSRVGSSQGRQKKVERVIFRLRNTGEGLRAGTKSTNVSTVYGRTTSHDMDTAVPLKTGDIKFTPDGGPQDDAEIYFEHNLPTACNIISMYAWLDVSDEN